MKDKLKKYKTFFKYILSSISSFLIDIVFFNLFLFMFKDFKKRIIFATILARVISSFCNYLLNKEKVFNSKEKISKTIVKYYMLVIIQMLLSAFLVDNLYSLLKINETLIKVPVEFILFISNYLIQKMLIFKNR